MHAFTVHPQKKPPAETAVQRPRRWRRWAALVLLLLGVGGLAWAVRPDPHLARAQALQKELFGPDAKNLSPDERKARFAEYRAQVKHLTDDQKWELSAPMREKQQAEMDRYFALSPKEKVKYLDERIDRAEKMKKEWETKKGQGKAGGVKGGGPPGGAKGGGSGGRPARSPEEVEKRRKQMLDRTTPEQRAQRDQYRKDMDARRRQRGLPTR
jgi:hypothetical protein